MSYSYIDDVSWRFWVKESGTDDDTVMVMTTDEHGRGVAVNLPAAERRAAAQALAGDEWRVVSAKDATCDPDSLDLMHVDLGRILNALGLGSHARDASPHQVVIREVLPAIERLKAAEPDRPEPIDAADVKVGDQVEVEADDGSWLVRGKVNMLDEPGHDYPLRIKLDCDRGAAMWPCVPGNTVRLVSRAEPEPDPEQVKALADVWGSTAKELERRGGYSAQDLARELVRRNVRVVKQP